MVFHGTDLGRTRVHERSRLGIGRTFQNLQLFHQMSVLDNVLVACEAVDRNSVFSMAAAGPGRRRKQAETVKKALRILKFVGLADRRDKMASELAFGHQRILEIARALASGPQLILLDEPAAGLTSAEIEDLMALIRRINREMDITVLLIGHTMRLMMGLSHRIGVLHQGKIIAEGTPAEVRGNPNVIQAYLGQQSC